jgi:alpha 1,2-mannosyltransferase
VACARCPDAVTEILPGLVDPFTGPWRHPGTWCRDSAEVSRHAAAVRALAAGPIPDPPAMAGAGVIACGGGRYWPGILVLVRMLRETGCTLPVQVWYRGSCEAVNPGDVDGLGVELVDADARAAARGDNRVPRGRAAIGGWTAKLYALAHTDLAEVIFLDADAYPVIDPSPLLELARLHGFSAWDEPKTDNIRWPLVGYTQRPGDPPPSIQGGQFAIDRRACWHELVVALWVCLHADYYWPEGRGAEWPLFGDQDAWRLAFALTGFRPHILGPSELVRGWGYLCRVAGRVAIEHRCFAKLTPSGTPGEARSLAHYAAYLGTDRNRASHRGSTR